MGGCEEPGENSCGEQHALIGQLRFAPVAPRPLDQSVYWRALFIILVDDNRPENVSVWHGSPDQVSVKEVRVVAMFRIRGRGDQGEDEISVAGSIAEKHFVDVL